MSDLLAAAKLMLSALPEGIHEKYLDESLPCPCTCPRCRLKRAVRLAGAEGKSEGCK